MQMCPECGGVYDESDYALCPRCYDSNTSEPEVIVFDRESGEAIVVPKSEAYKYEQFQCAVRHSGQTVSLMWKQDQEEIALGLVSQ